MTRFKRFFSVLVLMCLVAVTVIDFSGTNVMQVEAASKTTNWKWVGCCVNTKKYVRDHKFKYNNDYLKAIPLGKNKKKTVDCSAFVSDALYNYGFKEFSKNGKQWISSDFKKLLTTNKNFRKKELQRITNIKSFSQLDTGDILIYNGHVEVYVSQSSKKGYPSVYNCGDDDSIRAKSLITTSKHKITSLKGAIRVK